MPRALCLAACLAAVCVSWSSAADAVDEDSSFAAAARLYRDSRGDHAGAAEAFARFAERFPRSERAGDALYAVGEIDFDRGLALANADPGFSAAVRPSRVRPPSSPGA